MVQWTVDMCEVVVSAQEQGKSLEGVWHGRGFCTWHRGVREATLNVEPKLQLGCGVEESPQMLGEEHSRPGQSPTQLTWIRVSVGLGAASRTSQGGHYRGPESPLVFTSGAGQLRHNMV